MLFWPSSACAATQRREPRCSVFCWCRFLWCLLLGLVASATHLGNPENALYVLAQVGRSPLSNEVLAAVAFIGCAGIGWMSQFAEHRRLRLERLLRGLSAVAAIALVLAIAFAYAARTVETWDTPWVPAALVLNGILGGAMLAFAVLRWVEWPPLQKGFGRGLLIAAGAALAASTVVYGFQGHVLAALGNYTVPAGQLVPHFELFVVAYGLLSLAGVGLDATGLRSERLPSPARATVACLLVLAGIFVMRFTFYLMHLTVGMTW